MSILFHSQTSCLAGFLLTLTVLLANPLPLSANEPQHEDPAERELRELLESTQETSDSNAATPPTQPNNTATPTLTGSILTSMNPDIALIADFALAGFIGQPALVGGHDPGNVGFNLQGLELAISSSIDPYFRLDSSILLGLFGLEIEEAYGTTLGLGWGFQARAGQYLTAFGRANPTHVHQWNFVTQPLIVGKFFGGESMRGLGTELSQVLPLPWYANWRISIQNIAGQATGRSFLSADAEIEKLTDLTITGRLEQFFELSPTLEMLWGLSLANGANSSGRNNRTDIYGTDFLLKWNPASGNSRQTLSWQTELLLRRRQAPGPADQPDGEVLQDFGGYSELAWQRNALWQLAARYEFVSGTPNDYLDPDWTKNRQRVAASLTYFPSHFSRLRLEYDIDHLPYRETTTDHLAHMIFLQLELVAGAHGAHTY